GERVGELAHPAPVTKRAVRVVRAGPVGGKRVPVGRGQLLPGRLPVLGQQRGALVEALRVLGGESARNGSVDAGPALGELRTVGDLLRQGVLERVDGLRVELLLVHELGPDELAQYLLELRRGEAGDAREDG